MMIIINEDCTGAFTIPSNERIFFTINSAKDGSYRLLMSRAVDGWKQSLNRDDSTLLQSHQTMEAAKTALRLLLGDLATKGVHQLTPAENYN